MKTEKQKAAYEELIAVIAEENKKVDWTADFSSHSQEKSFFGWNHYSKCPHIAKTLQAQCVSYEEHFDPELATTIKEIVGAETIRLAIVGE